MKILKDGQYYGQKKKELKLNGIILSEYSYVAPSTDWHFHENPYFMYLLQGQIYDVNKKEKRNCHAGSLLYHNWQEQHYNAKHSQFARGFHIEFHNDRLEKLQLHSLQTEGSLVLKNPRAHLVLARMYREFQIDDTFSEIGIESLLISLCENIEPEIIALNVKPLWLSTLIELIYDTNDSFQLPELSTILGVHPVHISRTFSQQFGCTLSQYIRMLRIKKAIPYLFASKYNLTEIAYLCGFSDQSHFSRTFRQYLGMTPSRYKSVFN